MIWIFAAFMLASGLFDLWMLCRAERLTHERDTAIEDLAVVSQMFRKRIAELNADLKQAREWNEAHK